MRPASRIAVDQARRPPHQADFEDGPDGRSGYRFLDLLDELDELRVAPARSERQVVIGWMKVFGGSLVQTHIIEDGSISTLLAALSSPAPSEQEGG